MKNKVPIVLFGCPLYINLKYRVAKKYLNRWMSRHFMDNNSRYMWRWIRSMSGVKVGDLVRTCSGFNGRIVEINPEYRNVRGGKILMDVNLWTSTGSCSALNCGVSLSITHEQALENLQRLLNHPSAKEWGWDELYGKATVNEDGTVSFKA